MGPMEFELSDVLNNPGKYYNRLEGSLVILAHPRDLELMVRAVKRLVDTPYMLSLSAHYKTKRDRKRIREAFKDYWHLFTLVLWNKLSQRGHRSDVRYHNLEGIRIILRTWVIFIDSDLHTKTYFYGDHNGERDVYLLTTTEWLDKLFERMHQFRDKIFFGVKDNANWINWDWHPYGKPESLETSNLSGVWPIWLDNLQDYDPTYNPWFNAAAVKLCYFEDIAASFELWEREIFIRLNDLSWDGDRGGYDSNGFQRLRDAYTCKGLTSVRWMYISQKKDWARNGRFYNLKIATKDDVVDFSNKRIAKTVDELLARRIKENPRILKFKGGMHAKT